MQASLFANLLSPYRKVVNQRAFDPLYRVIRLEPDKLTAQSTFAWLETTADTGITEPCCVDGDVLLSVVDSLPGEQELTLNAAPNVLEWGCGNAHGKLARVVLAEEGERPAHRPSGGAAPSPGLVRALDLGAVSADRALAPVGIYGVVLHEGRAVMSSDSTTLAYAKFEANGIQLPELVTLPPEGVTLLETVVVGNAGELACDDQCLYYKSPARELYISTSAPLRRPVQDVAQRYLPAETVVKIPTDLVNAFVKRATAMAAVKRHTYVTLEVNGQQIALSFAEGTASADEYFLLEDSSLPTLPPIKLDAMRTAKALSNADRLCLDYISNNAITLANEDRSFVYIVAGRDR